MGGKAVSVQIFNWRSGSWLRYLAQFQLFKAFPGSSQLEEITRDIGFTFSELIRNH